MPAVRETRMLAVPADSDTDCVATFILMTPGPATAGRKLATTSALSLSAREASAVEALPVVNPVYVWVGDENCATRVQLNPDALHWLSYAMIVLNWCTRSM